MAARNPGHALDTAVTAMMREVAAGIMMPRFRKLEAHQIAEKTPGDLVTIVDQESEARLTEQLAALLPEARVVGEEAAAADPAILDRLQDGTVWVIDPLDGTMNFTEGKHPFAIMIALVADGETQAGWILDPVSGRMCHAALGQGAFVDGERVRAKSSGSPLPIAAIATYFLSDERRADIEARSAGRIELVAIPRCAGEQYPRLVLGQNDLTLFERTLPWDHLPGALFLEEAGGRIARPDGTPYRVALPGKGLIAAASPAIWDEAAEILFG
ncbi:MAG: inositol monophosphatase [Sphingomonas bacterium]|nr:inositol monophosphatase [Sphingomonas bacterium]